MPSNGLLNEERRREILGILHWDGRVLVKDLARHFRISQITIRKDLEFLDGRALKDLSQLTVITNAINIAAELAGTHIEVILTGGMLSKNSFSLFGPLVERTLRQLSADILFLGVDGFDAKSGLFTRICWSPK
jgi:DeoR/GlpR family transcriptional regulator of sugar metabolism